MVFSVSSSFMSSADWIRKLYSCIQVINKNVKRHQIEKRPCGMSFTASCQSGLDTFRLETDIPFVSGYVVSTFVPEQSNVLAWDMHIYTMLFRVWRIAECTVSFSFYINSVMQFWDKCSDALCSVPGQNVSTSYPINLFRIYLGRMDMGIWMFSLCPGIKWLLWGKCDICL